MDIIRYMSVGLVSARVMVGRMFGLLTVGESIEGLVVEARSPSSEARRTMRAVGSRRLIWDGWLVGLGILHWFIGGVSEASRVT